LDEQQQAPLVALAAALAGTHQLSSVVAQEADLYAVHLAVEDYVRLLDLQLLLLPALPLPPPHLPSQLLKLSFK
jgi:hypothetical protein